MGTIDHATSKSRTVERIHWLGTLDILSVGKTNWSPVEVNMYAAVSLSHNIRSLLGVAEFVSLRMHVSLSVKSDGFSLTI